MINRDYKPVVVSILEEFQQYPCGDLWEFIRFSLVTSPVPAYSSLFVPVVDTFELAARLGTAQTTIKASTFVILRLSTYSPMSERGCEKAESNICAIHIVTDTALGLALFKNFRLP